MDEGTSNPIVARIGSQLAELIDLCRIDKKKKEDLSFIFHEMMKEILAAHKQATPLIEELQQINENPSKYGLILEAHKRSIPSSLKLDNIKIFLKHANGALKLLAQALAVFFDKGWREAKFDDILDFIEKKQNSVGENWQVVDQLKNNLDWLLDIVELRNVDEHKFYKRQRKEALVKNYELSSKGTIFVLQHPKLCNDQDVLPFLIDAHQRLFLLCEEIIVATIVLFLPEPVSICEIPEGQRLKNFPKRFKHCLASPAPFPVQSGHS